MKKEMTIFYEVHDNIYVNLTNKMSMCLYLLPASDQRSHGKFPCFVAGACTIF